MIFILFKHGRFNKLQPAGNRGTEPEDQAASELGDQRERGSESARFKVNFKDVKLMIQLHEIIPDIIDRAMKSTDKQRFISAKVTFRARTFSSCDS